MTQPRPDPAGPGQESVWAYPRPAVAEPTDAHIVVEHRGLTLVDTRRAVRTLETNHPPTYYVPPSDVRPDTLRPARGASLCEWKGQAVYWDVVVDGVVLPRAAWSYPRPTPAFEALRDHLALYAAPFDRCLVDGERVLPQPGRLLRRLDHEPRRGPVQGHARKHGVVRPGAGPSR